MAKLHHTSETFKRLENEMQAALRELIKTQVLGGKTQRFGALAARASVRDMWHVFSHARCATWIYDAPEQPNDTHIETAFKRMLDMWRALD
jgi:hypothetical protein